MNKMKKFSCLRSSNAQTLPPKNVVRTDCDGDANEEDRFTELPVSNNPSNAPGEIVKVSKSNPSDTPWKEYSSSSWKKIESSTTTLAGLGGKVVLIIPQSNDDNNGDTNRTVSSKKQTRKLFKSFCRTDDQVEESSDLKTNNNLALEPEYCPRIPPEEIFKRLRSSALSLHGIESVEFQKPSDHDREREAQKREDQKNMLKNLKQWKKCPKCSFTEPADWMVCRCPKSRSIPQRFMCGQI
ncbi:hypothetical protein ACFX2J_017978 [Malus domestica]